METQRFMGSGQLVNRLTAQVRDKGFAIALLKKRGDMTADGKLTAKGESRNRMTAEERALDRADSDDQSYAMSKLLRQVFNSGWAPNSFAQMRSELHPKICSELFSGTI